MKKISIALLLALSLLLSSCSLFAVRTDRIESVSLDQGVGDDGYDWPIGTRPGNPVVETDPSAPDADPAVEHIDDNNDGLCDDCARSVVMEIDLFAMNDLHGKFADSDTQPGVDELTTYLKNAYQTEEAVILLSSGDMWQGSSESNLTRGRLMTDWMNELDFVSMTLGNHEFDWGEEYIATNAETAEFPFLAINIFDRETDERVDYCEASVVIERGGAKIGIIGAIGDCYSSISGEMSGGVYFKTGAQLTELVRAEAARLRAEGVDFIIYSLHDGYDDSRDLGVLTDNQLSSYYDPILSEGYVDLVFEGHTHQRYALMDGDGVYHLQNGGENRGISHVELKLNYANGNSQVNTAEVVASSVYAQGEDHPIVAELLKKYEAEVSIGTEVLGYNETRRSSDYLRNLVAKLYYEAGEAAFGDQYDIVLGGGFLSVRSPYELAAGQVTYSQLQSIFPFDNALVLCSVRGSDLSSRFVNTDNSNYFNYYGDYGQSVIHSIDPKATYYIVVDTYTSTYAPNRLTEVARLDANVFARDLLADYIRAGGFGQAPQTGGGEMPDVELTAIADIYAIGETLADNETTSRYYCVTGKIISIDNTTYGNMTIEDEAGNTLFVYGVNDESGEVRYGNMPDQPVVGDTVLLYAPIKRYVTSDAVLIELMAARLIWQS